MMMRNRKNETDQQWRARFRRSVDREVAAARGWSGKRAMRALEAIQAERSADMAVRSVIGSASGREYAWREVARCAREEAWWNVIARRTTHRHDLPDWHLYMHAAIEAAGRAAGAGREWTSIARRHERAANTATRSRDAA